MEDVFLTIKELAQYLKVKQSTIYNWVNHNRVPVSRVVGQWRFKRSEIDQWLDKTSKVASLSSMRMEKISGQKVTDSGRSVLLAEPPLTLKQNKLSEPRPAVASAAKAAAANRDAANISFLERRQEERIFIKKGEMFIKIAVSFPKRHEFVGQVVDMSTSGLSFILKGEKEAVVSGTPLNKIIVGNERYTKTINNSTVRYCITTGEEEPDNLKIGVQFDIKPFEHSVIRRKLLGAYKIRMQRYGSGLFTSLRWDLIFNYQKKQLTSDQILNFSKFGLACKIDQEPDLPSFQQGAVLDKFKLTLEDKPVYTGKATIVNLAEDQDSTTLRCSLEGSLDLEDVFSLVRSKKDSEEISDFIASVEKSKDIETAFKAEVADLRVFLEKTKEKLDAEEASFEAKESHANSEYYKKVILDRVFGWVFMRLKHHFRNVWDIVKDFDEERYNVHRQYFQDQLLHLFLLSPFMKRSFEKPLGYAGDYKMIDMIYSEPFLGDSIFAKALNGFAIQERVAQAVRNRLSYLLDKFEGLLKHKSSQMVRIMSVGSGPAKEVQEVIKSNLSIDRFEFTLIDADKEAISHSQDKITNLLKRNGKKLKVNFVNKAVDQIMKEKDLFDNLGKYDLIYSVGLFDYLTLTLSKRVTQTLYHFLTSNAKLIIGNFNHNIEDNRTSMDFILEWSLFYRSEAEMIKFTEKLEKPKKVYCESDGTGITNFLVIER